MMAKNEQYERTSRKRLTRLAQAAGTALLMTASGMAAMHQPNAAFPGNTEKQMTTQSKFFCNIQALTPEGRAHHKVLTDKLMKARKEIVETATGYEFQYSPADVSLGELADWVLRRASAARFLIFTSTWKAKGSSFACD